MVTINKTYALSGSEGSQAKATGKIAVLHSTATPEATAKNLAQFEKRTYNNAYVHFGVDDVGAYQVGTPGFVAWGAGPKVNSLSPLQIELCEFANKTRALKAYNNYIDLARQYAKMYGIPFTLDSNAMSGFKTHDWVSRNLGGTDHTDPYAYLAKIGISKAQFARDLANGVGKAPVTPSKPSAQSKKSVHDIAVEVINGKWGTDPSRSQKLKAAGYNSTDVQKEVNGILNGKRPSAPRKPVASGWISQNGTFTVTTPGGIKLRSGSASTKSPLIAVLPKGSMVKYNAYGYAGGYVWIRQPRSNGYGYLPTGEAVGSKRKSYWGKFK